MPPPSFIRFLYQMDIGASPQKAKQLANAYRELNDEQNRIVSSAQKAAVGTASFGKSTQESLSGVQALRARIKETVTAEQEMQKASGGNAAVIKQMREQMGLTGVDLQKLDAALQKVERDLKGVSAGTIRTGSGFLGASARAATLANNLGTIAPRSRELQSQLARTVVGLGSAAQGLEGYGNRLITTEQQQRQNIETTKQFNKTFGFGTVRRSFEAARTMDVASSSAHGLMTGMGLLNGSILQVGFSLIFLKFSLIPITAAFTGLTLLAGTFMKRAKLVANITKTFEQMRFGMEALGINTEMTQEATEAAMKAISSLDVNLLHNQDVMEDATKAMAVLLGQGLRPNAQAFKTLTQVAFATGKPIEEVAKAMADLVGAGEVFPESLQGLDAFQSAISAIVPTVVRLSDETGRTIETDAEFMRILAKAESPSERMAVLLKKLTEMWTGLSKATKPAKEIQKGFIGTIRAGLDDLFSAGEMTRVLDSAFRDLTDTLGSQVSALAMLKLFMRATNDQMEQGKNRGDAARAALEQLGLGSTDVGRKLLDMAIALGINWNTAVTQVQNLQTEILSLPTDMTITPVWNKELAKEEMDKALQDLQTGFVDPFATDVSAAFGPDFIANAQGAVEAAVVAGLLPSNWLAKHPETKNDFASAVADMMEEGSFRGIQRAWNRWIDEFEWPKPPPAPPAQPQFAPAPPVVSADDLTPAQIEDLNQLLFVPPPPAGGTGLEPFQRGGIVRRPTKALLGEAGPEAIIPLNRAGALGNVIIDLRGANILSERVPDELVNRISDAIMSGSITRGLRTITRR